MKSRTNFERILYEKSPETRLRYTLGENVNHIFESKYWWIKDNLRYFLPDNKDCRILVLGAGIGYEIYAFNKLGYGNILGIDISEEAVSIARSRGLNCIVADVFEFLRTCNKNFDIIIAFNFLEHFTNEEIYELLNLCYYSLSKEGLLLLSVPNASSLFASHCIYSDPTHKTAFTEISIRQLLFTVGFKEVICRNVKPFGKYDKELKKIIIKVVGSIIINLTWKVVKFLYVINGMKPPKVVSPDLLVIAYKGD